MWSGEQVLALLALLSLPSTTWSACETNLCKIVGSAFECKDKNLQSVSQITKGDCSDIETVLLSGNGFTELEENAFSQFPNAKAIDLENNKINIVSESAFSSLTKLQELLLNRNLLKDISSLILPEVTKLNLKGNYLGQSDDLSGPVAPKLKELVLSECLLSTFRKDVLSSTPQLTLLDLSSNQLQIFDSSWFEAARSVTTLILSDNRIASLSINSVYLGKLSVLDLSNNSPLKSLGENTVESLPELRRLILSGTSLQIQSEGPVFTHGAITHLSLAKALNSITHLPATFFSQLPALQWLDLSNNRLFDVEDLFNTSASLKVVILSENGLERISEGMFEGTSRLEELYLEANMALNSFSLSAVDQLANLHILDVSDTRLACDCSDDLWILQQWANATEIKLKDSCGNNLPCEWVNDTTDPSVEKCWVSVNFCPSGQRCCRSGLCATTCAGAALSSLPLTIVLLCGFLTVKVGNE